ncbi:transposase [Bacillus sp. N9]
MKRTIQMVIDQSEDLTDLRILITVFCSSLRTSFNRLLEGRAPKELIKSMNAQFDLNKRYAEDAVLLAQSTIDSQKELLPLRLEETQIKIQKTERKIDDYQTGKKTPKKVSTEVCLQGLDARLDGLQKKKQIFSHQENGTIPKVIFGGKKLLLSNERKLSKEEWKEIRSNTLYSRGDRSKREFEYPDCFR